MTITTDTGIELPAGPWKWQLAIGQPDNDLLRIVIRSTTGPIAAIEVTNDDRGIAIARLMCAAAEMGEALSDADRIMWMAERYAEGGGSHGPEMRDYEPTEKAISHALASAGLKVTP